MKRTIKIGITDCSKYTNYENWFVTAPEPVEVIRLSYQLRNANNVALCDGIVLSGGEDVHPKLYGKPEYLPLSNIKDIDERRDNFECSVLEKAFELNKPVFGICRGLQMTNVFLGGTLIPDIQTMVKVNGHSKINGTDQRHSIGVEEKSLLQNITNFKETEVNSAHHQAVDQPANDLMVIANANHAIVEAMQWKNPTNKSWLLLVQWHPERMPDQQNPFASNIREVFLKNCNQ